MHTPETRGEGRRTSEESRFEATRAPNARFHSAPRELAHDPQAAMRALDASHLTRGLRALRRAEGPPDAAA